MGKNVSFMLNVYKKIIFYGNYVPYSFLHPLAQNNLIYYPLACTSLNNLYFLWHALMQPSTLLWCNGSPPFLNTLPQP